MASVDSTPVVASASAAPAHPEVQDAEMTAVQQETESVTDDESTENQKHKCSISTMLNTDPVTPSTSKLGANYLESMDDKKVIESIE